MHFDKSDWITTILGSLLLLILFGLGSIVFIKISKPKDIPPPAKELLTPTPEIATQSSSLANPASENCINSGGTLSIKKNPNGGEYGVCTFSDNMQCEEWALFRGNCPKTGVKVTGYDNQAQIFCAISGGKTTAVPDAACTLPDGTICPVDSFYTGTCTPKTTPAG